MEVSTQPPPKGLTMKPDIKTRRTPIRMRSAIDSNGNQYDVQEWCEWVSVNASPWEPRNGHGQYMTLNGSPLERISSTQWETGQPPVELTLLE